MTIKEMIDHIIGCECKTQNWGISCKFFNIGKIGIKVYKYIKGRDISYNNQTKFAKMGAAPKTFGKFSFKTKYETYYCYVTETVEALSPNNTKSWDCDIEDPRRIQESAKRFESLTGCQYNDCHPANFGYLNGELVPIDFDNMW